MSRHAATRTVALAVAVVLAGLGTSILAGAPGAGAAAVRSAHRTTGASQVGVVSNYTDPSINGPTGITVGPDGALWFTNLDFSTVGRITTAGAVTGYADPSSSITFDVTAGPDGALWFTNLGNNVIGRITTAGAISIYSNPTVVGPLDIAVGSDGALWFTNNGNNSIGRITTAGVVSNYSSPTISSPVGITAGPDGDLWFTNSGNNSIGRITTAGVISNYTSPSLSDLSAITAGPDGALWFTNGGASIGRITTAGVITNHSDPTISDPDGITTGPDGALWFTNSGNNSIGRITTAGAVSNYTSPSISSPDGITTGPDGALWFTNYGNASIGRITTGDGSASQAITFTSVPPSNAMVGGPGYAVSATGGGSGNPVTLSVDPSATSVCSLSGSVVAFVGAGTCVVDANQAGSAEYSAAPLAQQRFSVHPEPPAITSVDGTTATVGVPFSFTVTTTGNPAPAITERGTLPRHLRFASLHNGTATVSGTPARAGVYDLTIRAVAGRGKTKSVVTQPFTLTVNPA